MQTCVSAPPQDSPALGDLRACGGDPPASSGRSRWHANSEARRAIAGREKQQRRRRSATARSSGGWAVALHGKGKPRVRSKGRCSSQRLKGLPRLDGECLLVRITLLRQLNSRAARGSRGLAQELRLGVFDIGPQRPSRPSFPRSELVAPGEVAVHDRAASTASA
jgi:hypothetical protein